MTPTMKIELSDNFQIAMLILDPLAANLPEESEAGVEAVGGVPMTLTPGRRRS